AGPDRRLGAPAADPRAHAGRARRAQHDPLWRGRAPDGESDPPGDPRRAPRGAPPRDARRAGRTGRLPPGLAREDLRPARLTGSRGADARAPLAAPGAALPRGGGAPGGRAPRAGAALAGPRAPPARPGRGDARPPRAGAPPGSPARRQRAPGGVSRGGRTGRGYEWLGESAGLASRRTAASAWTVTPP